MTVFLGSSSLQNEIHAVPQAGRLQWSAWVKSGLKAWAPRHLSPFRRWGAPEGIFRGLVFRVYEK
jgi:hypothetical protein